MTDDDRPRARVHPFGQLPTEVVRYTSMVCRYCLHPLAVVEEPAVGGVCTVHGPPRTCPNCKRERPTI